MADSDLYILDAQDGVGVITFNRPDKLNPVDWDLGEQLCALFRELRENTDRSGYAVAQRVIAGR